MKDAFEIADAIQWHEGMLLSPQHFQEWSRRTEQLLQYRMMSAQPFFWGIHHCKIDTSLLLGGRLCVIDLEAIMPDGLVIALRAPETTLELDLQPYQTALQTKPLTVYLAVSTLQSSLDYTAQNYAARYIAIEGKPVADNNTGDNPLQMPRLKPQVRLLLEEQTSYKFTSFPLFQISYQQENFVLTDFIAPTFSIQETHALYETAHSIVLRVREKATFLSERLKAPSSIARLDKPALFETQLIIQGLVSTLPQLEALIYAKNIHPYLLYVTLCGMAGNLSGFAGALLPPVFPSYNHNDLKNTFHPLLQFINQMLDSIHESYLVVAFELDKEKLFALSLINKELKNIFVIGVRIHPLSNKKDTIEWIQDAIIGTSDKILEMRDKRILGGNRREIEKDDDIGVISLRGIVLFQVQVDEKFITQGETLTIYNNKERGFPSEIIFYMKNKD